MKLFINWKVSPEHYRHRWGIRGLSITRGHITRNVHVNELLGFCGVNWKIRLLWFLRAWIRLLSLGYLEYR